MVTYEIELELMKGSARVPPEVVVRVGDVGTQVIEATLYNGGVPYVPSGMTARLDILKADGKWVRCSASISGSKVTCTLPSQALSAPGRCRLAHFVLFSGNEKAESTDGFGLVVRPEVDCSDPEEESDYYDGLLTDLYVKWLAYEEQAEEQEEARVAAEAVRKTQETARQNAETQRKSNELGRQGAETGRVNAEQQREEDFDALQSRFNSAVSACQSATIEAEAAAATVEEAVRMAIGNAAGVGEQQQSIDTLARRSCASGMYIGGTWYVKRGDVELSGMRLKVHGSFPLDGRLSLPSRGCSADAASARLDAAMAEFQGRLDVIMASVEQLARNAGRYPFAIEPVLYVRGVSASGSTLNLPTASYTGGGMKISDM